MAHIEHGNIPHFPIYNKSDLKRFASSYADEAIGIIRAAFTIDELISFELQGTHLIDLPPRTHTLTFSDAASCLSIENSDNWDSLSWAVEGLQIDLGDIATRAITTENGTSAKRTYQPHIKNCRIDNPPASAIFLNFKDVEAGVIEGNEVYGDAANCIFLNYYPTGNRQIGNTLVHGMNEVHLDDGGIYIQVDAATGAPTGQIGNLVSMGNHIHGIAGASDLVTGINVISSAGCVLTTVQSFNDRFENVAKMFESDATAHIDNCTLSGFVHRSAYTTADYDAIHLSSTIRRMLILGGNSSASGQFGNASRFIRNDSAHTTNEGNLVIGNSPLLTWVKTVGANNSWLENTGGKIYATSNVANDGRCADITAD